MSNPKFDANAWVTELFKRFGQPSPKFFQVLQAIGIVMALLGAVPDILDYLGIIPPASVLPWIGRTITIVGIWTKIMAKLPVINAILSAKNAATTLPFTVEKSNNP